MLLACGAAVTSLIVAAGFTWMDLELGRERIGAHVAGLARIVAAQAEGPLARGDLPGATEILLWLRADELVRDAALFDARGARVAEFQRYPGDGLSAPPPDGVRQELNSLLVACPAGPQRHRAAPW